MNSFPTHYMVDSPCYFCGKMMPVFIGIDHLTCTRHNNGLIWVIHHYDKKTSELLKVYFTIERGEDRYGYGFSLRVWEPHTTTLCHIPASARKPSDIKDILELSSIPTNLTPETAQEKLSFYLTYY